MQASDLPARFKIPFANAAGPGYIRSVPEAHQTATPTDAPASLTDGFPPETFVPQSSGGVPPSGADFNGILNAISKWSRWQAAGGPAIFDSAFSTAVGGYPKGAKLDSTVTPGLVWISTADNNTTDPDGVSPANWQAFGDIGSHDANGATLPGGLIIKWGVVSRVAGEGVQAFTFPEPFPNHCYAVIPAPLNPGSTGPGNDLWVQLKSGSITLNGFSVVYQAGSSETGYGISYVAFGD